jgi:hypothetical protein
MSGPTPSTGAVPETPRGDGAARTKEKLLERWKQPAGGRNRKWSARLSQLRRSVPRLNPTRRAASSPVDSSESRSWRKARI